MLKPTPTAFVRFCVERDPARRREIVEQITGRSRVRGGFYPYWDLEKALRGSHFLNDDIAVAKDCMAALVEFQDAVWKRSHYERAKEAFFACWESNSPRYVPLPGTAVNIRGLRMDVVPDIGV